MTGRHAWQSEPDLEAEYDGREPDVDDEDGHDADGLTEDIGVADLLGAWEQGFPCCW